jgi:DNA-binding XRE family transcriptional regulator
MYHPAFRNGLKTENVLLEDNVRCPIVYTFFVLCQDKGSEKLPRIIDAGSNNITGERIKKARLKAGLSQSALSAKLELMAVYVCRGSVSRIETGERTVTDIEIDAISKVLQVSLDGLFGRKP